LLRIVVDIHALFLIHVNWCGEQQFCRSAAPALPQCNMKYSYFPPLDCGRATSAPLYSDFEMRLNANNRNVSKPIRCDKMKRRGA